MPSVCRSCALVVYFVVLIAIGGFGQSLGDVARAQRQKQQSKDAKPARKVVTDEDMPQHEASVPETEGPSQARDSQPVISNGGGRSAEEWKAAIQAQKNAIAGAQSQLDRLKDSVQFAPGNCVSGCVEWNERQVKKQEQAKRMESQIAEQKKKLDDMQEAARRSGFGSAVYDP